MRKLFPRSVVAALLAGALAVGGAACSSQPTSSPAEDAVIIDVRTPQEFSEGHLEGSVLLDLNGGQFATEMVELDPEADYLVYCRSGNRSAQAVALLKDNGFTSVTDLGSMESAASATGLRIVTD